MTLSKFTAIVCIGILFLFVGCREKSHGIFTDVRRISATPVKNQGEWSAGWIYATLSLIESERICVHDSLELSPTYLMRKHCEDELTKQRPVQMTATPTYCFRLLERHGIILHDFYRQTLFASEKMFLQNLKKHHKNRDICNYIMDTTFAYVPPVVSLYGVVYTPLEMMNSVFKRKAYEAFATYSTDSLPGDRQKEMYTYVCRQDVADTIVNTLNTGHTLVWYGDTLCAGYSSREGVATETAESLRPSLHTACAHAMHIIGMAHPQVKVTDTSLTYFIAKDSHGVHTKRHGYMYLSENFIRQHTIALYRLKNTQSPN